MLRIDVSDFKCPTRTHTQRTVRDPCRLRVCEKGRPQYCPRDSVGLAVSSWQDGIDTREQKEDLGPWARG